MTRMKGHQAPFQAPFKVPNIRDRVLGMNCLGFPRKPLDAASIAGHGEEERREVFLGQNMSKSPLLQTPVARLQSAALGRQLPQLAGAVVSWLLLGSILHFGLLWFSG